MYRIAWKMEQSIIAPSMTMVMGSGCKDQRALPKIPLPSTTRISYFPHQASHKFSKGPFPIHPFIESPTSYRPQYSRPLHNTFSYSKASTPLSQYFLTSPHLTLNSSTPQHHYPSTSLTSPPQSPRIPSPTTVLIPIHTKPSHHSQDTTLLVESKGRTRLHTPPQNPEDTLRTYHLRVLFQSFPHGFCVDCRSRVISCW